VIYPLPLSLSVKWAVSGAVYFMVLGALLAAIYRPSRHDDHAIGGIA
jgi:hypothetical protein